MKNLNLCGDEYMKKKRIIAITAAIILVAAIISISTYLLRGRAKPISAAELLQLGEKYLSELNYEQAVVQFDMVIDIEPKEIRAYLGGADAYLHLDKQQEAADLLKKGIKETDNKNLAHALEGVEKSPIEGYIAISEAYEAEGWHERAIEILQRVYSETGDEIIGRKLGIVEASSISFRDDYVIQWKDAEFERLIRDYLGKPEGDIHYDDVKSIENIEIWGEYIRKEGEESWRSYSYWRDGFRLSDGTEGTKTGKIKSLEDLEHFTSLTTLTVTHQENLSISALEDTENIDCLKRLKSISLIADSITDISPVSGLIALETIELGYNNIENVSPISMLIELQSVALHDNEKISSAEPLRGLRKLWSISLSGTNSIDLNVFVGMPIKTMHLVSITNADYSVLTKLEQLDYLEISCDDDIFQTVKQLKSLTRLRLHADALSSIEGIEALTNLKSLDLLAYNLHDISPLASLNLEELEIIVPENCDLTPLSKISTLKKVIVPEYYGGSMSTEKSELIQKVKSVIPNVEVTTNRH